MVLLAGRTFTSEFWQYALISDPLAFSMRAFAPVILARVRNVALLIFGKLFNGIGVYSRLPFACGYHSLGPMGAFGIEVFLSASGGRLFILEASGWSFLPILQPL